MSTSICPVLLTMSFKKVQVVFAAPFRMLFNIAKAKPSAAEPSAVTIYNR